MSDGVTSSQGGGPSSGAPGRTNSFRGGILVAVAALLLLLMTFSITSPTVPRILTIAIGLLGVATAFGFIPVRAPQDYYGGIVLMMLAILALIASADLPGQRGFAFGPGTAPRLFAVLLFGLSAAVTLVGVTSPGPADREVSTARAAVGPARNHPVRAVHPATRAGRRGLPDVDDLDLRFDRDALDRERDRGGGDDRLLRAPLRLPAQSSIPALAAAERRHAALATACRVLQARSSGRS